MGPVLEALLKSEDSAVSNLNQEVKGGTMPLHCNTRGLTVVLVALLVLAAVAAPAAFATPETPESVDALSPGMSISISLVTLVNIVLTAVSVGMWIQTVRENAKSTKTLFARTDDLNARLQDQEREFDKREPLPVCAQRLRTVERVQQECLWSKLDPESFARKDGAPARSGRN